MSVPVSSDQVPAYLRASYDMLVAAFPSGIPEAMYLPLLALLADHMSQRSVANVIAFMTGKETPLAYHDLLVAISPYSEHKADQSSIDQVKQLLIPHGYERWCTED